MSEKSVLTKKNQKKEEANLCLCLGFVICVSESVVVIFGCKIDFLFLFFYDWVLLCNNYRLGLEMVGRGLWGPTGRAWGFEKNLFIKRVKFG